MVPGREPFSRPSIPERTKALRRFSHLRPPLPAALLQGPSIATQCTSRPRRRQHRRTTRRPAGAFREPRARSAPRNARRRQPPTTVRAALHPHAPSDNPSRQTGTHLPPVRSSPATVRTVRLASVTLNAMSDARDGLRCLTSPNLNRESGRATEWLPAGARASRSASASRSCGGLACGVDASVVPPWSATECADRSFHLPDGTVTRWFEMDETTFSVGRRSHIGRSFRP